MKKFQTLAVVACYLAVLLWAYATIVSPAFAYSGYNLTWPGPFTLVWLIALCLTPVIFLPVTLARPSALILWWLYMTVYIPSILLPALSLTLGFSKLLPLQLALLASLAVMNVAGHLRRLAIRRPAVVPGIFWPTLLSAWAICLTFVCIHFNFATLVTNIASLFLGGSEYTIRNGFIDELSQSGRLLGYTAGQVGEALNPFLIAYGLIRGKVWPVAIGVFGQLMIFAVVGAKSIFFSTFFIVIVYFLMTRFRRNFGLALSSLLLGVVVLAGAVDISTDGILLSSITTRRTLMDPGLLTGFYFEHYLQATHAGLGYHFARGGEAVPAPSYEIGLIYFGDEHIDANANLWAEGFADFGVPGIFGFTLILALLMWLYDSVATRNNNQFAILLIAMPAFAFSNSAPLTVAITHGGVLVTFLLWCSPDEEADRVSTDQQLASSNALEDSMASV